VGTLFWYLQRLSAVVILSYVLYVAISFFVKPYNISAAIWSSDINGISFKIFSTLFLFSMFFHGIIGLKAVEDDYLSKRTISFVSSTLSEFSLIFRIIFRVFVAMVVLVTTYVFVFNYLV
jgi:succinate dehydrogenase hydrophobic membrane anchor protein